MKPNLLTKNERKELKKQLIHGDMQKIADKLFLNPCTVYDFFKGVNNNSDILHEIIKIIEKNNKNVIKARSFIIKNDKKTNVN